MPIFCSHCNGIVMVNLEFISSFDIWVLKDSVGKAGHIVGMNELI